MIEGSEPETLGDSKNTVNNNKALDEEMKSSTYKS